MSARTEIRDLAISVAVLSFAFYNASRPNLDLLSAFIIVTLAFVVHEMGHRYLARKYGCFAEFRMWPLGVLLALLSSFTGFIFAAPGAVYISPYSQDRNFAFKVAHLTRKEYGKISLFGPATNIAIGTASFVALIFLGYPLLASIASISFYLGLFNLLPIPPLDGSKVFAWDRKIWLTAFAVSIIGLALVNLLAIF